MRFKLNIQNFAPLPPNTEPTDVPTFDNKIYVDNVLAGTFTSSVSLTEGALTQVYIVYHNNSIYALVGGFDTSTYTVNYVISNGTLVANNLKNTFTGNGYGQSPATSLVSPMVADTLYAIGYFTSNTVYFETQVGFTITYETNGGTAVSQATSQTALPNPLPTTTKDGFNFGGWFTDSTLTTQAVAGATITADTTLYAKWVATVTIDLTTLTGWESLSSGAHTITVKAKADGYKDSLASQGVSVTKPSSGETWVINASPSITSSTNIEANINFISNSINYSYIHIYKDTGLMPPHSSIFYNNREVYSGSWENASFRTVTFETAPTGSLLTWLQNNAVKQ